MSGRRGLMPDAATSGRVRYQHEIKRPIEHITMNDKGEIQSGPDATATDEERQNRRDFLIGLGRWSKVVIGTAIFGGLASTSAEAEAGWINRRGGWINGRGRPGGGWINGGRGGGWINGGGGWVNGRGGRGSWLNRR